MSKDHQQLLARVARLPGWTVCTRRGGHVRVQAPDGRVYFTGSSPSDYRAVRALRAGLRRMGASL